MFMIVRKSFSSVQKLLFQILIEKLRKKKTNFGDFLNKKFHSNS